MATGLLALLDDVAALVKVTAVTLDDIPAQIAKTGSKVSGVVIDDAAVTPKYVVGLSPQRELAIIYRIARSSLINKLLFIAPGALLLGYLAPWAMVALLMLGGCYLCMEGYEKIHGMLVHATDESTATPMETITPEQLEAIRVKGAVRTDLILSAEIIAITYSMVAHEPLVTQIIVLFAIAVSITVLVYGFVGLVVKADDVGLYLARTSRYAALRAFGRGLVKAMPPFLKLLGIIGTATMLWVGGEIVAHGIPPLHHALAALQAAAGGEGFLPWLAKVLACAIGGLGLGAVVATLVHAVQAAIARKTGRAH